MAFGKSQQTAEAAEYKKYIGQASLFVRAFNPTKEELSKLYGRDVTNDQTYVGTITDNDGKEVQVAHLNFICQTDPATNNGIEEFLTARFTIQNKVRVNKENTKCQVIDEYGRTAWATQEEVKNHTIPTYKDKNTGEIKNMSISANYRPAFVGEEVLTDFLRKYLNFPEPQKYVNNEWVPADNLSECECRLDNVANYFKGDFKEIKDIISIMPTNKFKAMVGVRTTDDGKQYMTLYTNLVLKNNSNAWNKVDADIQNRKENGALQTTEFDMNPLHEYTVTETNFSGEAKKEDLPFTAPTTSPWG